MENVVLVILGFLVAAVMGQVIIPKILLISFRKRLFDVPDERKVHTRPVPRLGGVTFFPTILFVLCFIMVWRIIFGHLSNSLFTMDIAGEMLALIAGLTLLYLVGIGDDLVGVRYRSKSLREYYLRYLLCQGGREQRSYEDSPRYIPDEHPR